MQTSILKRTPAWRTAPRRWLICLDLQRDHVAPGRPRYAAENADVAATCIRVLGRARDEGWRIVHSQLRESSGPQWPRELFSAPIEGLRPLISEPVFFRRASLSAFSDPAFAAELREARGDEVFLIGFSLTDTCLATALGAVDEGLALTLLDDAIGTAASAAAAAAARLLLGSFVRLASSRQLDGRAMEAMA